MKHILFTFALLFCVTANAAYIVESSPGVVTGIGELNIGGTLYNVDFEANNTTLGAPFQTFGGVEQFWNDGSQAFAAFEAINSVLNSGTFVLNNAIPSLYGVWFPSDSVVVGQLQGGVWIQGDGPLYTIGNENAGTAWSVAAVPVPAAAWLFGSALLGLAGIKRRKV